MVDDAIGSDLTATQTKAARLMAKILDPRQVDAILDLPPGSVDGWMGRTKFAAKIADLRRQDEMYDAAPSVDYGRALAPKQRAAARALTIDRKNQNAAAASAGVDSLYGSQLAPPASIYLLIRSSSDRSTRNKRASSGGRGVSRSSGVFGSGQSTALEAVIKGHRGRRYQSRSRAPATAQIGDGKIRKKAAYRRGSVAEARDAGSGEAIVSPSWRPEIPRIRSRCHSLEPPTWLAVVFYRPDEGRGRGL